MRLQPEMSAGLLERDLNLPTQDEPADDLQWILSGIGAQQRLRREPGFGIAQQPPPDWHDGHPTVTPHSGP